MKRSIIFGVIAVAFMVISVATKNNSYLLTAFLILFATAFSEYSRRRHPEDEVKPFERTVDDLTAEYGEPEDLILLNAIRANEAMGVILAYKDFFIVEGRRIEKGDIRDVTFNNSGTPYTPAEYQVIIVAGSSQSDYIHINTGYDATWAKDVVEQIKKNL